MTKRIDHVTGCPRGVEMDIAWNMGSAIGSRYVGSAFDDGAHNEIGFSGVRIGERNSVQGRSRIGVENRDPAFRGPVHAHRIDLAAIHQQQERRKEECLGHLFTIAQHS